MTLNKFYLRLMWILTLGNVGIWYQIIKTDDKYPWMILTELAIIFVIYMIYFIHSMIRQHKRRKQYYKS